MPGYVVGVCAHRVARSEWAAGFVTCERCDRNEYDLDGFVPVTLTPVE